MANLLTFLDSTSMHHFKVCAHISIKPCRIRQNELFTINRWIYVDQIFGGSLLNFSFILIYNGVERSLRREHEQRRVEKGEFPRSWK